MAIPVISASTGRTVNDGRQSTYGSGLGTVYQYGHAMPYGPYSMLQRPGAGGTTGSGSSSASSQSGKTPEAQQFLNQVMSGEQLPYSPDRINRLKSAAGDQNAAAESALSSRMAQNAAAGGASATDPSYQAGQMALQARRQTANQTAGRQIDEAAEGANFDAKMRAASMLEQSRMQAESLQNQLSSQAMSYMPWNQGGGGGGKSTVNNFNLAEQRSAQSLYEQERNRQMVANMREDAALGYNVGGSGYRDAFMRDYLGSY